jgi:hypothetical protein
MTKRYDLIVEGAVPAGLMADRDADKHGGVQRKDNQNGISN